jgi:hypothetical protein
MEKRTRNPIVSNRVVYGWLVVNFGLMLLILIWLWLQDYRYQMPLAWDRH